MSRATEDLPGRDRGTGSIARRRSSTVSSAADFKPSKRSAQSLFEGKKEPDMFSLNKTLPKDDSSDSQTGSATTSDDEGEPLITMQVSQPTRDAVVAHAEEQEMGRSAQEEQTTPEETEEPEAEPEKKEEVVVEPEAKEEVKEVVAEPVKKQHVEEGGWSWNRYDDWPLERLERELALHVAEWGTAHEAVVLPTWPGDEWPRDQPPRRKVVEEKKEEKVEEKVEEKKEEKKKEEKKEEEEEEKKEEEKKEEEKKEEERPELDLTSDIDYESLKVLPILPSEAPSLQQTKQYKNYMKLRYETQRRNPEMELPKVVSGWYRDGKPSSLDPEVQRNSQDASQKLESAMAQLKAAKEGKLPVVKVTHRMSMADKGQPKAPPPMRRGSSRKSVGGDEDAAASNLAPLPEKQRRRFSTHGKKRLSMQFRKHKDDKKEDLPDEIAL